MGVIRDLYLARMGVVSPAKSAADLMKRLLLAKTLCSAKEKTETGVQIHILDALAEPAIAAVVNITPTQNLNGYSKPWAGGAGVNLFPDALPANAFAGSISSAGVIGTATNSRIFYFSCEKNTDYTFSKNAIASWTGLAFSNTEPQIGDTVDYRGSMSNRLKWTQNSGNNTYIICVVGSVSAFNDLVTTKEAMIVKGSTEQPYSPYSNICPITGLTGLSVYVSPSQDVADATTYAVDWTSDAGTVYGGTMDVVTGLLTVTTANIASYNGETIGEPWLSSLDKYAAGTTPTTGAQVVYTLATPLTYRLTAQEVQMLLGENYIWSSSGDSMIVTYLVDGNETPLESLNLMLGNRYSNPGTVEDVSDREALNILLGR